MADALNRWCLVCDAEIHSGARGGPRVRFTDYVDDLIARSRQGVGFRVYENENRVMRVAEATRIPLSNGREGLAMVLTLGDRRGSSPTFLHFERGHSRDPERLDGEVKGFSAHAIIELAEDEHHVGRHRMLLEDVTAMGRTPVSRILCSELREISTSRDERFRSPDTGGKIQLRPVIEIWPRKSSQIEQALEMGRLGVVELYDIGRVAAFDEQPDLVVRRRTLKVEVLPSEDGLKGALERLRRIGLQEGYANMKLSWRLPDGQIASSDVRTDLEDLGTALLAQRELVTVGSPMSDATHCLNDEFLSAMAAHFE